MYKVLEIIPAMWAHSGAIRHGVYAYAREQETIQMPADLFYDTNNQETVDRILDQHLATADGIVACVDHPELCEKLSSLSIPVVNLFERYACEFDYTVIADRPTAVSLAYNALVDRGVERVITIVRHGHIETKKMMHQVYQQFTKDASLVIPYDFLIVPPNEKVASFVKSYFSKCKDQRVGVISRDNNASNMCRWLIESDVKIPEQMMVVAIGSNTYTSPVPLSYVDVNPEGIGYQGIALLHKILQSEISKPTHVKVKPIGFFENQSTNIIQACDHEIRPVMQYIASHLSEPIIVDDLLRIFPISRSTLERKFKTQLKRTPLEEIRRQRVEEIKHLLISSTQSMPVIAAQTGFNRPQRMATVFKQVTGYTPTQWRSKYQGGQPL